jgi:hypothetical protein
MKRLSYQEIYAEVHGKDFMTEVRNHVIQLLNEEPEMSSKFTIEKPLEPSILDAEFVDREKEQLAQYVLDRVSAIERIMDENIHNHYDYRVKEGARGLIYDCLKEIERVHPCIVDELDPSASNVICNAQNLFMKRLWV